MISASFKQCRFKRQECQDTLPKGLHVLGAKKLLERAPEKMKRCRCSHLFSLPLQRKDRKDSMDSMDTHTSSAASGTSVRLRWKQLVSMLSLSASILSSATPFNMGYAFKKLYVHMREQSAPLKIPYTPVSRTTRITSRFSSRQKVRLVCSHT